MPPPLTERRGCKFFTMGRLYTRKKLDDFDAPWVPRGEKRPADVIGAAVMIARIATGELEDVSTDDGKNDAAVAMMTAVHDLTKRFVHETAASAVRRAMGGEGLNSRGSQSTIRP